MRAACGAEASWLRSTAALGGEGAAEGAGSMAAGVGFEFPCVASTSCGEAVVRKKVGGGADGDSAAAGGTGSRYRSAPLVPATGSLGGPTGVGREACAVGGSG